MTDTFTAVDEELTSQLARSQQARRERILRVVIDLAAEGGYDAVQVREVAKRADVALRTIYNYYESREQLLYAALMEWRRGTASESVARVSGRTFEQRALSLLRHMIEDFVQRPKLFETFMRLGLQPGDQDPLTYNAMSGAMEAILAEVDPGFAEDFQLILGRFVYATLALAAQGAVPLDQVWPEIERTVRRVAASRPR